jgi:beta-lactamase regulating signal transducer with metallopeptidase domain
MIETLLPNVSLWGCLWQSTLFAVLGLAASVLLRRRPARAHQVLLLAMLGAVLVPALSGVVRHFHLGLFTRPVTVPELMGSPEPREIETGTFVATSATEAPPARHAQSPAASSDPAGSGAAPVAWRTVGLWTWAAATWTLIGRLLFAFTVGVRLSRRARPVSSGPVVQALHLAQARLGAHKDLQIRTEAGVRSPVIWCWGRQPVLLLPDDVSCSGGGIDWVGVLAHELAHWKRGDHVTGLLAELVVCVLPWNPLLWWSKRHLVSLTEQACDDWVVASGQPAEDYAESLLGFKPQNRMAFVPAVVHSKKGVAARVRRILNDACGNPRTGTKWALGVTVLVACVAVGLAFAQTRPAGSDGTATRHEGSKTQSADQPSPNSEKREQPRFAARTFNAKTSLSVYVQETSESEPGLLGW